MSEGVLMRLTIHQLNQETQTIESVRRVKLATPKGQAEILPGHEAFFALTVAPGINYLSAGSEWQSCATPQGGFVSFEKDSFQLWIL